MNPAFNTVITASQAERRDLFLAAAARLGTAVQNVEKDFWVCWTLDALFNGLPAGGPRLLFKGGTSLSNRAPLSWRASGCSKWCWVVTQLVGSARLPSFRLSA